MEAKVCKILDDAGDYIKLHFCKFIRHGGDGKVCAIGAIEYAADPGKGRHEYDSAENSQPTRDALKLLAEVLPEQEVPSALWSDTTRHVEARNNACQIANFNNKPNTTAEDVAAKFHEAAELCRTRLACDSNG